MIGKTKVLLAHANLGGSIVELIVTLREPVGDSRLIWTTTSQIDPGSKLGKNAVLILEHFIDPLARMLQLPLPSFTISFQKTPWFVFKDREQAVVGTSASVALLLAMLSSLLEIPLSQSAVITGVVEPPHTDIRAVEDSTLPDKIAAADHYEEVEMILVPDSQSHFRGMSHTPPEALRQYRSLETVRPDRAEIIRVRTIDDVWQHFFPPELIFETVFSNPTLYDVTKAAFTQRQPVEGFLTYLRDLYESRWDILSALAGSHGPQGFRRVFEPLLHFYIVNGHNVSSFYQNLKTVLQLLSLENERGLFTLHHWATISRLFSLDQYDDLLRLLLLAAPGHVPRSSDVSADSLLTDGELRDSLRQIVLSAAEQGDFSVLYQTLVVLVRKFSAEQVIPDIRLDLNVLLKEKFFDGWTDLYSRCVQDANALPVSEDPNTLLQLRFGVYRPFLNYINRNLHIIRLLVNLDPITATQLRRHESFQSVVRVVEEAQDTLDTATDEQERLAAQVDIRLFGNTYSQIRSYDDQIGYRLLLEEDQIRLNPDHPTMTIEVAEDLSTLEFRITDYAVKKFPQLADVEIKNNNVIRDPVLLWQESYNLPNYWKPENWGFRNDEILALPDGHQLRVEKSGVEQLIPGIIQFLFGESYVEILHRNVSIIWNLLFRWPPSIDSLFFINTLAEHGYFDKRLRSAADIGSGTGCLGIALAKNSRYLTELYFVDVLATLKLLTEYNVQRNLSDRLQSDLSVLALTGSGVEPIKEFAPFDLILCSPPYLPNREMYQTVLSLESPVEGTDLLEEVVLRGKSMAKEVVIQFSEIALPEFKSAVSRAGAKDTLLASKTVPLRIPAISPYTPQEQGETPGSLDWYRAMSTYTKLKSFTDMLVQERNLLVRDHRNFKYWQNLLVYSVTY